MRVRRERPQRGFANASLTHGLENGLARFADELVELERLGRENLDASSPISPVSASSASSSGPAS